MHSIPSVKYLWNCEIYGKSILDILFLSITFVVNLSCSDEYLLIYTQDMPKTFVGLHVKYLLFLFSFNQNWNVLAKCSQSSQHKFIKIHSAVHVVSHIQMERQRCSKLNRCFIGLQTWSQKYESYNKTLCHF